MFSYNNILDISVDLNNQTVVYPGTPEIKIETTQSSVTGSRLSQITFSSHVGTHVDAPLHVIEDGKSIDQISLDIFMGTCRVIDCTSSVESISLEDAKKINPQKGERILLKTTNSQRGFNAFYSDFIFVSPEAAQYFAEKELALIGIDYFSIKQQGSKDNRPHTEFLSKNIPILEGVDLSKVEEGEYFLVCVPLKFTGIDGSPVRALLLS